MGIGGVRHYWLNLLIIEPTEYDICNAFLFLCCRLTRNESEKLRRDRLNAFIGELAKIVPMNTNRKMDKSSILRLAVNYLRVYHSKFSFLDS